MKTCLICSKELYAKNLCRYHYNKMRLEGIDCSVEGCKKAAHTAGMCQGHWRNKKLYGDPNASYWTINGYSKWTDKQGYVWLYRPDSPYTTQWGRIMEHRLVMSEHLGRKLLPQENVHHINGDRSDNRLENLELWNTSQPKGQRVEDKVEWAKEILGLYGKG